MTFRFPTQKGGDFLAYDVTDGTLWQQMWSCSYLAHYDTNGTLLGTLTPLDALGNCDGVINGICVGAGNTLYVSHPDARVTMVDKTSGSYLSLLALHQDSSGAALPCDGASFAPQVVLWWKFGNSFAAYAVESGTCVCECPPADSLSVKLNTALGRMVLRFFAPQAGNYKIFSTTSKTSEYPTNFIEEATVAAVEGWNEWTDPGAPGEYKRYVVVHECGSTPMATPEGNSPTQRKN